MRDQRVTAVTKSWRLRSLCRLVLMLQRNGTGIFWKSLC